jgi:hypothetical protein
MNAAVLVATSLLAVVGGGDFTGYIIAAWGITFGAVGVYAAAVIRRGRRLSKVVPPEQRRWM